MSLFSIISEHAGILPDGLDLIIQNTIDPLHLNKASNNVGVPLSHPIHIQDLFTPYGLMPTNMTLSYTVAGLSKLLLFNSYARAQSKNITEYINMEAMKYPYSKEFRVRGGQA